MLLGSRPTAHFILNSNETKQQPWLIVSYLAYFTINYYVVLRERLIEMDVWTDFGLGLGTEYTSEYPVIHQIIFLRNRVLFFSSTMFACTRASSASERSCSHVRSHT
jgi:hypothetical protein